MKRLFYLVTLVTAVLFINGCAEEDPAEAVSVDGVFTNKATVEGYVYLNTNKSSTEAVKFAPDSTLLYFSIPYSDLGVSGNGNYVKTTTVDANGHYSIELPAKANGSSVTVSISGAQILLTVTTDDGKSRDQIFKVSTTLLSIRKGLTYIQKLEYEEGDILQESETWTEGTYRVKLEYSFNSTTNLPVPSGTEVKVTVPGSAFVPERIDDWVFIKKVGDDGLLEIKLKAPSLLDGGLTFGWTSAFVADVASDTRVDSNGNPIKNKYKFDIQQDNVTIYGGITVEARTLSVEHNNNQLTFN
jgi:hypothetical protein